MKQLLTADSSGYSWWNWQKADLPRTDTLKKNLGHNILGGFEGITRSAEEKFKLQRQDFVRLYGKTGIVNVTYAFWDGTVVMGVHSQVKKIRKINIL